MTPRNRSTTHPLAGTAFHVLLALADRPRYGLDIVSEVDRRTDGDVRLGPGTLYNAVKKMLADGLIAEVPESELPDDEDPRRRFYRITSEGRSELEREAERLQRLLSAAREKKVLGT